MATWIPFTIVGNWHHCTLASVKDDDGYWGVRWFSDRPEDNVWEIRPIHQTEAEAISRSLPRLDGLDDFRWQDSAVLYEARQILQDRENAEARAEEVRQREAREHEARYLAAKAFVEGLLKQSKWTREPVMIHVQKDGERHPRFERVEKAQVWKSFAIHRDGSGQRFVLTHVPSGLAAGVFDTATAAKTAAVLLDQLPIDWRAKQPAFKRHLGLIRELIKPEKHTDPDVIDRVKARKAA